MKSVIQCNNKTLTFDLKQQRKQQQLNLVKRVYSRCMDALVLVAVAILVPWSLATTQANAATAPISLSYYGPVIYNAGSGLCIDEDGNGITPGSKIQLWDCGNAANMQWTYVPATGALTDGMNHCIDITGGNQVPWTPVQSWPCNGTDAQRWTLTSNGSIVSTAGLCLDAYGGGTADGTQLQIYPCNGSGAQIWDGPATPNGGSALRNSSGAQVCAGIRNSDTMPGDSIEILPCDGTGSEQWKYVAASGALQVYANECIDIVGGVQTPGQNVQLWPCNGTNTQRWTLNANGTIVSSAGLCLDYNNFNYNSGEYDEIYGGLGWVTPLVVNNCNGAKSQIWSFMP
ncbi:MAG: ricin-type beta-trefoil lectin domain protein [Rhodanobacter sp.]|jgi:hypothetical protein|nr:ricin-type beta-trefoil lectin domain protein [Rhodanobacter sp.]